MAMGSRDTFAMAEPSEGEETSAEELEAFLKLSTTVVHEDDVQHNEVAEQLAAEEAAAEDEAAATNEETAADDEAAAEDGAAEEGIEGDDIMRCRLVSVDH